MNHLPAWRRMGALLLGAGLLAGAWSAWAVGAATPPAPASPAAATSPATQPEVANQAGQVKVARFYYGGKREEGCFADGFLATIDRQSTVRVRRQFAFADLGGDEAWLHEYPFAVLTGDRPFTFNNQEKQNLRSYLARGGFLLASASCSTDGWARSFRELLAELFPDAKLAALGLDHPIFNQLYHVKAIVTKAPVSDAHLYGLEVGGRLAVVFSPLGLNDTANAGGGCCCCGGNEIRDAQLINANVLVYALTH